MTALSADMPCPLSWRFLNYSRASFRYQGFIEGGENTNKGFMGLSAFADMWHLSHGQYFIGHMGSRFSKASWSLSSARHNTLVPFISIDGRTPCCEIDEVCSNATAAMGGMVDCLAYAHELAGSANSDYWTKGSTIRWTGGKKSSTSPRPSSTSSAARARASGALALTEIADAEFQRLGGGEAGQAAYDRIMTRGRSASMAASHRTVRQGRSVLHHGSNGNAKGAGARPSGGKTVSAQRDGAPGPRSIFG